jgi:hypothetical protein
MPRLTIILLTVVVALVALATAESWWWTWRDETGPNIEFGEGPQDCKNINHQKGMLFEYDSKDSGMCILMYGQKDCAGNVGGYACHYFSKASSGDIGSYQIVDEDYSLTHTTGATTAPPTTATTITTAAKTTTESTAEPTAEPTEDPIEDSTSAPAAAPTSDPPSEDDGSSLSGGAIAGIVIGVIAAIAIGGIIAWILFRRNQRNASRPSTIPSSFAGAKPAVKVESLQSPTSHLGGSKAQSEQAGNAKWGSPSSPTSPEEAYEPGPEPYTPGPPPGVNPVELSSSNQIVELDATNQSK